MTGIILARPLTTARAAVRPGPCGAPALDLRGWPLQLRGTAVAIALKSRTPDPSTGPGDTITGKFIHAPLRPARPGACEQVFAPPGPDLGQADMIRNAR